MDDYPNPEEEYDLLHEEEMEVILEMEREMCKAYPDFKPKKSKNSLNFDHVPLNDVDDEIRIIDCDVTKTSNDNVSNRSNEKDFRKRCLSVESLTDLNPDLEIVERPSKKLKSYADPKTSDSNLEKEFGITSFRVPSWPFMTVRTHTGDRLYIKLNDRHSTECVPSCYTNKNVSEMLVIPYKDLRAVIEESFLKKLTNNEINCDVIEIEEILNEADLWVEKFKPKTYFDLLSDEAVNRTLLNWLKLWDKIVFNKEVKEKPNNVSNKENNYQKNNFNKVLDADGRPHFKVALLCGPPGLGKTTLAHIAAVMTGYNVVEINASDDRSIETLSAKLDDATQMKAVMGKCRPNCLILDEIDGAPAQTVDFLLKYLNGKYKVKKGKKEKNPEVVKRPVICICNELYTPSLRQLRQQAFIIHFPNTSSSKLVQRLLEICKKQDIKTDLTAITLLCEKAQNDIRSCISTLHFFKNMHSQRFRSSDVLDKFMGQKDIQKSVFNIWKEIFHNPIGKVNLFVKAQKNKTKDEVTCVNYSQKEMNKLQSLIHNCQTSGDYERLSEGVFENFLKSKFSGGMESVYKGLDWFCWFDLLNTTIKKSQNYFLMSYLPYSFGMWQTLYSSNSFWKITYPTAGYENHVNEAKQMQILNDVAKGLSPSLRAYHQKNSLLFDVLPLLDVILNPPLRPVNPALFNEDEKKDFKHLIDVMCDFNLTYVQQRSLDGTYSYQLDPNANELIKFNVNNQTNQRTYSYNLQQIISHELDLERMRRGEDRNGENSSSSQTTTVTAHEKKTNDYIEGQSKATGINKPGKGQSKPTGTTVSDKEGFYKDFFGRVVKINQSSLNSGLNEKKKDLKSPIWFFYKQGYNNAVKKDIYLADIL